MKLSKITLFAFSLITMLSFGCQRQDEPAPELPPEASFLMEFEDFKDGKNAQRVADSTSNFGYAATNVLFWNVAVYVQSAVPVAAFKESFNHSPRWDRNLRRFVWDYNMTVLGVRYTAQLQGWIDGQDSRWEMYISKDGGFQNFRWYAGRSAIARNNASWNLYKNPGNPVAYLNIEYNANSLTDATLRYTNVLAGNPDNGSYIEFALREDMTYDRAYTIHTTRVSNTIEIKWNHLDHSGRVKSPAHFGDADWYCWDAAYLDASCN